jgi:GDPmannose 4,6-dehydratase
LASTSRAGASWDHPVENGEVNALGVARLLESLRIFTNGTMKDIKFFQASSSEIFGQNLEGRQNERTSICPTTPYGVAKAYGHQIVRAFREGYGSFAVSGILFNHESPRRTQDFVTRKISLGVARIARGDSFQIRMGNLDSRRDWGHALDYVQAMHKMLQLEEPMDFVLGTGVTHSVRDVLTVAFGCVGISNWEKYVVQDPSELRRVDNASLVADPSLAKQILGWEPKYSFEQLIQEMVEADVKAFR